MSTWLSTVDSLTSVHFRHAPRGQISHWGSARRRRCLQLSRCHLPPWRSWHRPLLGLLWVWPHPFTSKSSTSIQKFTTSLGPMTASSILYKHPPQSSKRNIIIIIIIIIINSSWAPNFHPSKSPNPRRTSPAELHEGLHGQLGGVRLLRGLAQRRKRRRTNRVTRETATRQTARLAATAVRFGTHRAHLRKWEIWGKVGKIHKA